MFHHLNKDEISRLLQVAKQHKSHDHLMIAVAYLHGLRCSEVLNLRGRNIRDEHLIVKRLKGSLKTTQPLFDEERGLEDLARKAGPKGLLFGKYSRMYFWRLMKRYGKLAGIPDHKCRPHQLKHTCAMIARNSGMAIEEVKEYLGHKNINSTAQYFRASEEEACDKFRKAIT